MSRALDSAYRKGYAAAVEGADISACPYRDVRKWDGRITWSRAFENAWRDGWQCGKNNNRNDTPAAPEAK